MLGDKIKKLRKEKGITQDQLADSVDVSRSTIGMIETNKKGASNDLLKLLADFFGVTTDYLLGRSEEFLNEDDIVNEDIRFLARAGKQLSSEEAKKLRQLAETLYPDAFKND